MKVTNKMVTEALEFYANEENWKSPSSGYALQYDPEPSPLQKDRGGRAKMALMALKNNAPNNRP